MILDTHQHFWQLSRGDYPWPDNSVAPIFRDFLPNDLKGHLSEGKISQTILVQATDSVAETEFLLELAAQNKFVAGVVGWAPLEAANVVETIDRLALNPILKGLRPMLQNIPDRDWILRDDVKPALTHMQTVGLRFDALVQPRHLAPMLTIAKLYPDLKIVVDHASKPTMSSKPAQDWVAGMTALGELPNVYCKLSGMVTEIGSDWSTNQIAPYAQVVFDAFGAEKVMWGSDWPVVNLAADYLRWLRAAEVLTNDMPKAAQRAIFWETGHQFYGITKGKLQR